MMPPFSIFAAVLLAFLIAPASAADALMLQAKQIKALGIETAIAAEALSGRGGSLPARVLVPNEQMRIISAPVSGMVELLAVAPGEEVKRGQMLARLASPQALELQRELLQANSQAQLLQQNRRRDELLFAEGIIAEARLQATRAAAAQAAAQASERRQGLALAGIAAGQVGGPLTLVSPIDGVVLEQGVQIGQRVDGAALIYRIAKLTPLWLEIQAPLAQAAQLRVGMVVQIANSPVSGRLIAIGRAIDAASQTVLLRAAVSEGAETLRPGQVVAVELPGDSNSKQQRLPAGALARNRDTTLVFVQTHSSDQGMQFEARPVRIISQGGDSVLIEGIDARERIVIKGISGLKAMLTGVGRE